MRRILPGLLLAVGLLVLAGCGNKGPLVRPPAATAMPAPAAAVSRAAPASASSAAMPHPDGAHP